MDVDANVSSNTVTTDAELAPLLLLEFLLALQSLCAFTVITRPINESLRDAAVS